MQMWPEQNKKAMRAEEPGQQEDMVGMTCMATGRSEHSVMN